MSAEQQGHEYIVVDGLDGWWLAEVSTEYPEPSPIGRIDDILDAQRQRDEARAVLGVVAALRDEARDIVDRDTATKDYLLEFVDRIDAVLAPVSGAVSLTADGQANDCTHQSATGIDTAEIGPDKVWRCDHCGLTWTDRGRPPVAKHEQLPDHAEVMADLTTRARSATSPGQAFYLAALAVHYARGESFAVDSAYSGMVRARRIIEDISGVGIKDHALYNPDAVAKHEQEVRAEVIDRFVAAHRKSIDHLLRSADDPVYEDDAAAATHLRSRAGGMAYVVDSLAGLAARADALTEGDGS